MLECIRHEKILLTIIICRDIGWFWTLFFCVGVCCSHGEQGVFARVWLPCVCGVCSPPFWLGLLEFKEPLSFLSPPSSFSHPLLLRLLDRFPKDLIIPKSNLAISNSRAPTRKQVICEILKSVPQTLPYCSTRAKTRPGNHTKSRKYRERIHRHQCN